ncbi:unnamed protein product [Closterium sp. Naga37s-1]|nr:unnamed protein product [Closterium sp. Naga37s-1]
MSPSRHNCTASLPTVSLPLPLPVSYNVSLSSQLYCLPPNRLPAIAIARQLQCLPLVTIVLPPSQPSPCHCHCPSATMSPSRHNCTASLPTVSLPLPLPVSYNVSLSSQLYCLPPNRLPAIAIARQLQCLPLVTIVLPPSQPSPCHCHCPSATLAAWPKALHSLPATALPANALPATALPATALLSLPFALPDFHASCLLPLLCPRSWLDNNKIEGSLPTGLWLDNNKIEGSLPTGLCSLPLLWRFNNYLYGPLPDCLFDKCINQIDVSGNSLYGRINRDFKHMVANSGALVNLARNFFFGEAVLFAAGCKVCPTEVSEPNSLGLKDTSNWRVSDGNCNNALPSYLLQDYAVTGAGLKLRVSLSGNCLTLSPSTECSVNATQRSTAACQAFCSITDNGPCDGHGVCVPADPTSAAASRTASPSNFTCLCDAGYSTLDSGNGSTCAIVNSTTTTGNLCFILMKLPRLSAPPQPGSIAHSYALHQYPCQLAFLLHTFSLLASPRHLRLTTAPIPVTSHSLAVSSLSTGAIVGITLGCFAGFILLAFVVTWLLWPRGPSELFIPSSVPFISVSPIAVPFFWPPSLPSSAIITAFQLCLFVAPIFCLLIYSPGRSSPLSSCVRREVGGLDVCEQFSLQQMLKATNNWSEDNVLGKGGFDIVYKGRSSHGQLWAIKRSTIMTNDFETEVRTMASLHHTHLVRLLGFCLDQNVETGKQEQILVYEFIGNRDLEYHIHATKRPLSLRQRLRLAQGAAEGLAYLHGFDTPIVHRDIKPANILVTGDMQAKVADFGLLKRLTHGDADATRVAGTPGYVDPDYNRTNVITAKSDVFSFGIVLLELLSGKPPRAMKRVEAYDLEELRDSKMPVVSEEAIVDFADLALDCIKSPGTRRPTMKDVACRLSALIAKHCPDREDEWESVAKEESEGNEGISSRDVSAASFESSGREAERSHGSHSNVSSFMRVGSIGDGLWSWLQLKSTKGR